MRVLNYNIRHANPEDITQIVGLIKAHAAYERADFFDKDQAISLPRALFGANPQVHCLVVEAADELLGYATYMPQYSTWDAAPYLYMDCLYLKEEARGAGLGKILMKKIMKEAQLLDCRQIQWHTPVFNTRAIGFYVRLGAAFKTKERFFLEL